MKRTLLRLLRLRERPEPPPGSEPTLQVFRASRRFFYLQSSLWGMRQLVALAGIVFSLVFLHLVESAATQVSENRGFERFVEEVFEVPFAEVQQRVTELWPWIALIETLAIVGFVLSCWLGWSLLRLDWEARWYMVSDESLRIREGLLRTHERTMTVANIQNLSVRSGPIQKLLGIADLEVHTAGGGGGAATPHGRRQTPGADLHVGRFRGVDDAEGLRNRIAAAMLRHRDSGLGNPDEAHLAAAAAAGHAVAIAAGAGHAGASPELQAAAAELLEEARRLHAATARYVAPDLARAL